MLEIKLTVSLDETAKDTLDRLIAALGKEATTKVEEHEEAPAQNKAKAPLRATAAPVEEAQDEKQRKPPFGFTVANQIIKTIERDVDHCTSTENITIEELRTLLVAVKREKGTDAIKAVLKDYGVSLLSDLDPSRYVEVAQRVREL